VTKPKFFKVSLHSTLVATSCFCRSSFCYEKFRN
jgi:hypothetical protein